MKGFSDEERDVIRRGLLETARKHFAQYGPQKTTISELTNEVGIGTSTFYKFFDSKEDLYIEIMLQERARLVEHIEEILGDTTNTQESLREFLEFLFDELETNPLLRSLFLDETGRELFSAFVDGTMDPDYQDGLQFFIPHIRMHQTDGDLPDGDPEIILNAIKSVVLVSIHRDTVPDELYDDVCEMIINMTVSGLTSRSS